MKPFGLKLCLSHSFLDDSLESGLKHIEIFYQKPEARVYVFLLLMFKRFVVQNQEIAPYETVWAETLSIPLIS